MKLPPVVKVQEQRKIDCLGILDADKPLCRIWERDLLFLLNDEDSVENLFNNYEIIK